MQRWIKLVVLIGISWIGLCLSQTTYVNPVIEPDSPDPGVLNWKNTWYVVTTSGDAPNIFPIHYSKNLVDWIHIGYVFPEGHKPKWTTTDFWAPELHIIPTNGKINVYYAARNSHGRHCIGVAYADSPVGPFTSLDGPLTCNESIGYIDPTYHSVSASETYLYWKTDGNAIGVPCVIYAQPLEPNGLSVTKDSKPIPLITNDLPWEATVVEAPWIFKTSDYYYLFYSGNGYATLGPYGTCRYAVGVARSRNPTGPFVKKGDPILSSLYSQNPYDLFTGPGHCSVVSWNSTADYMVYHAWSLNKIGGGYPRHLMTDRVTWRDEWPVVYNGHPSDTPQPVP